MVKKLLFILLFPSLALAANQTQFVTTTCGNNGDGTLVTCAGSPGGAGAYNTFANWEGQNRNLVTENINLTVNFAGIETSSGTLAGWTTNSSFKIALVGLMLHTTDYGTALTLDVDNVSMSNCEVAKTATGAVGIVNLATTTNVHAVTIEKCTFYHGSGVTRDGGEDMVFIAASTGVKTFRNLQLYRAVRNGMHISITDNETINWYNNTSVNSGFNGFLMDLDASSPGSFINIKNNLGQNSGILDFDIGVGTATYTHNNNVSKDTSSPDAGGRSKTATFVNAGANDFRLTLGDTAALNLGADLSGTGFSTDLLGTTRPQGPAWDSGTFETIISSSSSSSSSASGTAVPQLIMDRY